MTIILDPPPYVLAGQVTSSIIGFERVLVGRSAVVSISLTDSTGTAADPSPDSATVQVVRFSDQVELVNGAATDTGTGGFAYTLTPAHTSQLDYLLVNWTATVGGYSQTLTQVIEVCGGFLFSIADARRLEPLDKTARFPAATIASARTLAEQALEEACGVAFVPRYHRQTLDGTGTSSLLLSQSRVSTIRSVTVDSTAYTTDQISALGIGQYGQVANLNRWTTGAANVTVDYEHGYATPPLRVSRAALLLARSWLVGGPVDDRASTFSSADGGTYSLVTPGRGGSVFGLPEVDAVVQQYGLYAGLA